MTLRVGAISRSAPKRGGGNTVTKEVEKHHQPAGRTAPHSKPPIGAAWDSHTATEGARQLQAQSRSCERIGVG